MNIFKCTTLMLVPVLLVACAAPTSQLPAPPAQDYINGDPANVRFDKSSLYITDLLTDDAINT